MFFDRFIPKIETYPEAAKGWVDGVYHEREKEVKPTSWSDYTLGDSLVILSKSWTETEPTGFGVYNYVNTVAITYETGLCDGTWTVTIDNPSSTDQIICCKANDVLRLNKVVVPAGKSETFDFDLCSIEETTRLVFYIPDAEDVINITDLKYKELPKKDSSDVPSIFLASDSTVSIYKEEWAPQTGWGQVLPSFTKELPVINKAIGARSSKSFILEGRWEEILELANPGDYVLIQFGHNDATPIRPNRYCTPTEYKSLLKKYVDSCNARDIIPVIITPVSMRVWDDNKKCFPMSFSEYRDQCFVLSVETGVTVIDLGGISNELLNNLDKNESRYLYLQAPEGAYPESNYKGGVNDHAHLSYYGALNYCKLVVQELIDNTTLSHYLTTDVKIEKPGFIFPAPNENADAPKNFTIQEIQYSGISANFLLSWDKVAGAEGYIVMRKSSKEFQFSELRRVSAAEHATSTVLPFTLLAEDSYELYVVAIMSDGLSKPSSHIHADLHNHLS